MSNSATLVKSLLAKLGFEVRRNKHPAPQSLQQLLVTTESPVIFDVGAHTGETYKDYRRRFSDASLHLIEPFEQSATLLKEIASTDERAHVHQVALSDVTGESTLHVNHSSATNSLQPLVSDAAARWGASTLTKQTETIVKTVTLDSLCESLGISEIDIIKIDVQGTEMCVLKGAEQMFNAQNVGLLQMEYIAESTYERQRPLHEYLEFFHSRNYQLLDIYQPIRRNGKLLQCDLLFANQRYLEHFDEA